MQTRKLGNTDLELTTIGLGTWAIGGGGWLFGWGAQDEQEAVDAIVRAVDLGVNWVDTAAIYGGGRSESLVGRALKALGPSRRPIVATKCSRHMQADGSVKGSLKRESILQEAEDSLQRLGVDVIDLYQVHWPLPTEDVEEGWQACADLVKAGKVRHLGVSNFSIDDMKRIAPIHPIASLQPPYSMLVRDVERELLDYCRNENIGVVVYSPMYKGLLIGAFDAERAANLSDDDHRSRDPRFQSPQLEVNLRLVDSLRPIAEQHGKTLIDLSIAWVLRRPEVTSAIIGARRPAQIEGTAAAGDWTLPEGAIRAIDALLAEHDEALQAVVT